MESFHACGMSNISVLIGQIGLGCAGGSLSVNAFVLVAYALRCEPA
jgi:hypothetical protein